MKKWGIYIETQDFFLTQESFKIIQNPDTHFLETYPLPPPKDLSKYYQSDKYISHSDSRKTVFDKIYQQIKKFNLRKKLNLLPDNVTLGKLLDYGCGVGDFLEKCQQNGWNVTGIEPNSQAATIASKKIGKPIQQKAILSSFKKEEFDVVTLFHVLEHVHDLDDCCKQLKRILKPDGTLIIAVPNYESYDAQFYKKYWAAYDTPRHLWHFSKKSMPEFWKVYNMNVVRIHPMIWDSFYVSMLSEKYKKAKFGIIRAFLIGLLSNIYANFNKNFSSLIYVVKKNE